MADMIAVAEGFQSSVNIAYDLNDDSKLKNYIPTRSALDLLESILLSTKEGSTDRARILIGAYGKGKSHIVLMILSILMKKDRGLFEKMMPVIRAQRPELNTLIDSFYDHGEKLLPVVIAGSSNSIVQAFMLALQRTLAENELQDIMPETNYQAAVNKIADWKENYPGVYEKFSGMLDEDVSDFVARLNDYDPASYLKFEKVFPELTAGSTFNPFVGFDVVELYASVIKSLKKKGYGGIYVVYDEFSKYLENHISEATMSDTKTLQDFAEYCGRSGGNELHLMLISHKEITSYIGNASKQTIDGWRGVSERFNHVYLNNNFTQTYEIIASAIRKDAGKWDVFKRAHKADFESLYAKYADHPVFSDLYTDGISSVLYDCYPLHPVSTFILPRLSERVAQNERTLFTFISAAGSCTLSSFLKQHGEDEFALVTPDLIFDYFEPLMQQEIYSGNLHKYYTLAASILRKLKPESLGAKLIKSIALIYILEQFEKLSPTVDELVGIYSSVEPADRVKKAIDDLIEDKYVIYLKRSNGYLKLKETSGVNIGEEIASVIAKRQDRVDLRQILNSTNFDNYLYPSRYNDEREMTRYFRFEFIDADEAEGDVDWKVKSEGIRADGVVFAVIPKDAASLGSITDSLLAGSAGCENCVFVIPKSYHDIQSAARTYDAVRILMDASADDQVLFDDYEIVYDDMQDVIRSYISIYTHPENNSAVYIFNGKKRKIRRKSELSGLCSDICDSLYGHTPRINNEVINKQEITAIAKNSRAKLLAGLLQERLEKDLGLRGTGQEVSIMRSTLLRTGVLKQDGASVSIDLSPADPDMRSMLQTIVSFIQSARTKEEVGFDVLYRNFTAPENHIGLRNGLIPIYTAAVCHEYLRQIVIRDNAGQIPLNADTFEQINANPSMFSLSIINWDKDKEAYIQDLASAFGIEPEGCDYDEVARAIRRWYMALPKYAKNVRTSADGAPVSKEDQALLSALRQGSGSYDLLFSQIPKAYRAEKTDKKLAEKVLKSKGYYDQALDQLKEYLIGWLRNQFCTMDTARCEKMSLTSIIRDWCEKIDPKAFEQLFTDGTSRCLSMFREITNDEDSFIMQLARTATDLRLEDWDSDVIDMFRENMKKYQATAEGFHTEEKEGEEQADTAGYQLSFTDENGEVTTRRFGRVETTPRGKLLYNSLVSDLEGMGQSISDSEKRQILMNVLKSLC